MRKALVPLIAGLVATTAANAAAPLPRHAELVAIGQDVKAAELKSTITHLVGFGTRHTMSDATSPARGIGAARAWVKSQFNDIATACGGCLTVVTPEQTVTGERVPTPTLIQNVIGIQRGTGDPDRVVIISGHIDSRVTDVMNVNAEEPGANDDASGVAAVMEAARVLSHHKFKATIVYAVLNGEEQGLYGGKLLADYAKAQGWKVEAQLNNDIIGNTHGLDGRIENTSVRVFSEGTRATETPAEAKTRAATGGEMDAPSRNLARFIVGIASDYTPDFRVRMILRTDRFGRGGDQLPMQAAGYPAVRLTEADENYTRQHQDIRVEGGVHYGDVIEGVDFPYLAKVARLNILTLAALADAPPPSTDVKIKGAVTADTTLTWAPSPGAASYRVWWRETTAPFWTQSRDAGAETSLTLKNINIDDYFYGVSAVSADGYASPVEFPGVAGAFFPAAAK
jgi:hypothetical protein